MLNEKIDRINQKTMCNSVGHYAWKDALTRAEAAALEHVEGAEGKPILDLGVGAGRTVAPLRQISENYTGMDYVCEMVTECQRKFPDVRFEHGDARDLSRYEDGSFYLVMFSLNGISMVDHQGRMKILKEVYRILAPGGSFLFSTYNQHNGEYQKLLHFPDLDFSWNPLKMFVRSARFGSDLTASVVNRYRFKKHEKHTPEYSIVNDRCHNYATMLYYITHSNQLEQLESVGFDRESVLAFDLSGKKIENGTKDDSIFYLARKHAMEEG